ncbi:hypothetical protein C8R47DRAFT_977133 [Mycena vitilis]|nr:hypothetical protein C8R47DRAFT_977133 [Mycena vitilis]
MGHQIPRTYRFSFLPQPAISVLTRRATKLCTRLFLLLLRSPLTRNSKTRSVKERTVMLQQRNAEAITPAVGHAAPLRAKIAQFESRGGVPLPRGLQSFGIGAPPPVDHAQQRRGELYGNRMKPVWVPGAGPPSLATRAARDEGQRSRKDIRQEVGVVCRCACL